MDGLTFALGCKRLHGQENRLLIEKYAPKKYDDMKRTTSIT